nr:transglutaminase-like domain-containing protein [uncultured Niameybacter sp.]
MRKLWMAIMLGMSIAFMGLGQVLYAQPAKNNQEYETLKKQIGTKEQAIKQLDGMFPTLWHSYHLWQGQDSCVAVLRSGEKVLGERLTSSAGRSDMATTVAYLLSDDYKTGTIYAFQFGQDGSLYPIKAATYIYKDGKYYIFDPVVGMKADEGCRNNEYIKSMTLNTLEEFGTYIKQTDGFKSNTSQVYAVPNGEEVRFVVDPNTLSVQVEHIEAKLLYSNTGLADERFKHINPDNIKQYKLPKMLGGLTLSVEQARVLVDKSPQEVKAQVRTAGDLLLYMLASRTLLDNGDQSMWADGQVWHYNKTAKDVLSTKRGNCGSMANLANYLLEDDYEDLGFVLHSYYPGSGGGHVYNYIKYQGNYYIVDFSSYLFNNYSVQNEFNFIKMKNLGDYGTRWNECYGGLAAIIVHKSPGTHLPNVWSGNNYYFPVGSEFEVLLETPDKGYKVGKIPMPSAIPDWRIPQQ